MDLAVEHDKAIDCKSSRHEIIVLYPPSFLKPVSHTRQQDVGKHLVGYR